MGFYFGNHFNREPFQFDSVGNHWLQEDVTRPDGFPMFHYLQTESGCGCVFVKGEKILLQAGQGILLAPFIPHSYHTAGGRWITSFATFCGSMEAQLSSILGCQDYLRIEEEKGNEIKAVIASAIRHFAEEASNRKQLSMDCYHMLLLFSEDIPPDSASTQSSWEKYVKPVINEIEQHYMEELSTRELAKSVYVSPQYLSRLFVHYLGCSVYEYLTNYRITAAKKLLLNRSRKIQDIAHDVGYTDASHFIFMFRKLTKMTPAEFRKLHVS